jgi:ATP-dependent DNA helicase RecG
MPYSSYCQVSTFDFGINFGLNFGINFGINETQCKIVELMITNPEIITEQIAEAVGITKRQIEANISKLKALGIVERIGARKKGRWVVKRKK